MKKFYYFPLVSIAMMAFAFTSCSEDDNEPANGGSGGTGDSNQNAVSAVITTNDGEKLLLTSANRSDGYGYSFTYDSNGRPLSASVGGEELVTFSYNPFKMIHEEYNEDGKYKMSGELNSNGYLSTIIEEGTEDGIKLKKISNLEYDNVGHIVKVKGELTAKMGKKETTVGTFTDTYTWQNGNMKKIEKISQISNVIEEDIIYIGYDEEENLYNQYTLGLSEYNFGALAMMGFIGKGTANLPSSIQITYRETDAEDDYEYEEENSVSFSFDQNENGTIASERVYARYSSYADVYNYTYSTVEESRFVTPAKIRNFTNQSLKESKRHRMFRNRSIRHVLK